MRNNGFWRVNGRVLAMCVVVFLCGSAMRVHDLGTVGAHSPDERVYAWEADAIAQRGMTGLQEIAGQFRKDPSLFGFPTPARAGYLYAVAAVMRLTDDHDVRAGAELACWSSIMILALLGLIAWRNLSPLASLLAMLLYAVSPPVLAVARRGWQETFVELFVMLLFGMTLEVLRSGSWRWVLAAGAFAGFAIVIKEVVPVAAAVLILLLAVMLAMRRVGGGVVLLVASFVSLGCALLWVSHAVGGLPMWVALTKEQLASAATVPYSVGYQTGSFFEWLTALWESDPLVMSFGLMGVVLSFKARDGRDKYVLLWPSLLVAIFVLLPALSAHRYNLRFVAPVFALLCLLAGYVLEWGCGLVRQVGLNEQETRWTRVFAACVLLLGLSINGLAFEEKFVQSDLQDLSLRMLETGSNQP